MVWFLGVVVVLVVGAVIVVAAGRGGGMSAAYDDRADVLVPTGAPLTGDTLRGIRFSVGFRGYRISLRIYPRADATAQDLEWAMLSARSLGVSSVGRG